MFEKQRCTKDYCRLQPSIQLSKVGVESISPASDGIRAELTRENCPSSSMDDTSPANIRALEYVAKKLVAAKEEALDSIADKLIAYGKSEPGENERAAG